MGHFWWQNSQTSKQFQIYSKIVINHQNGFFLTVHVEIPFNSFHGSLVNAPRASQRKPIQFSHWATCTLVCLCAYVYLGDWQWTCMYVNVVVHVFQSTSLRIYAREYIDNTTWFQFTLWFLFHANCAVRVH